MEFHPYICVGRTAFKVAFLLIALYYSSFKAMAFGSAVVSVICIAAFLKLRIPPVSKAQEVSVLGSDPLKKSDDALLDKRSIIKAIAHRGAYMDAPENTLPAFEMCFLKGCNAIEFDVMLTADNVPVICHDDTLDRVSFVKNKVSECTWNYLKTVDIGAKHTYGSRFPSSNVPSLESVLVFGISKDMMMLIDVKDGNNQMVSVILNSFESHPELFKCAVVSSFSFSFIYKLRRANPKIVCSLAYRPFLFSHESYSAFHGLGLQRHSNFLVYSLLRLADNIYEWAFYNIFLPLSGVTLLVIHKDVVSPEIVEQNRRHGLRLLAWAVNHPTEKAYFSRVLKVTYFTDTLTGEQTSAGNIEAKKSEIF